MGIREGLLNFFNVGSDDDYDDYDDYDEYEDDYEEEPKKPLFKRKNTAEDDYEEREPVRRNSKSSAKITSMRQTKKGSANMELSVIKPVSFEEDGRKITDTLRDGCTVVLNLEGIDIDLAQRIIDFASGLCYAIDGNFRAISKSIILITPPAVEITGDFMEQVNGSLNITNLDF